MSGDSDSAVATAVNIAIKVLTTLESGTLAGPVSGRLNPEPVVTSGRRVRLARPKPRWHSTP